MKAGAIANGDCRAVDVMEKFIFPGQIYPSIVSQIRNVLSMHLMYISKFYFKPHTYTNTFIFIIRSLFFTPSTIHLSIYPSIRPYTLSLCMHSFSHNIQICHWIHIYKCLFLFFNFLIFTRISLPARI